MELQGHMQDFLKSAMFFCHPCIYIIGPKVLRFILMLNAQTMQLEDTT